MVTKKDIINMLKEFIAIYSSNNESWKSRAYQKSIRSINDYSGGRITTIEEWIKIPNIGKGIASKIVEFQQKGKVTKLNKLKRSIPSVNKLMELTQIPGVGIKKAKVICEKYNIKTLKGLYKKLEIGVLKDDWLINGLRTLKLRGDQKRIPIYKAYSYLAKATKELDKFGFIKQIIPAGSMRRVYATVKDIDVIVVIDDKMSREDAVKKIVKKYKLESSGKAKCYIPIGEGRFVDLYICHEKYLGTMLLYLTGSGEWNEFIRGIVKKKGGKLNQYCLIRKGKKEYFKSERKLLKTILGRWVPPECREKARDIGGDDLVKLSDIKGDLHIHSTKSDGQNKPTEIAKACKELKYKYFGLADHLGKWTHRDLVEEDLLKWIKKFSKNKHKLAIKGLLGGEIDISKTGKLSIEESTIRKLDYMILSSHQSPGENLEHRYITNMEKFKDFEGIKILAHPINRNTKKSKMLEWDDINWLKIFQVAKACSFALEINGCIERMDLDWTLVRKAKLIGCKFHLSSDAHSLEGLLNMQTAVIVARKGKLTKKDVINCKL